MTPTQRSARRALVVVWLAGALLLGLGLWRLGGGTHRPAIVPPSTLPVPR